MNRTLRKLLSAFLLLVIIGLLAGGYLSYRIYSRVYKDNVSPLESDHAYIFIPTGSTYADVLQIIGDSGSVIDLASFKWTASRMGYPHSVKPGRYMVKQGMNNKQLVSMLRAGIQSPVMVTFTGFRTPQQLAEKISAQLEVDSIQLVEAFQDEEIFSEFGFSKEGFIAMFIPNTYEFYWNTGLNGFLQRMKREFDAFWNASRTQRAEEMGMSPISVVTLASIVEEETIKNDERARVAGVYMNRLKYRMPLQADPTIKFAHGDFEMRRVLTKHLSINSPYNTYKNRGLPPGPINSPSISSIDAVLKYESHKFLYFCAKPDFSGYHAFATNLADHNKNAREYQRFLNNQRIYR